MIEHTASAKFTTNHFGEYEIHVFQDEIAQLEHVVLTKGQVRNSQGLLCRVASECITGTVLDSADCDCSAQMQFTMELAAKASNAMLVLLRQEGRGHGLTTKVLAMRNKNEGDDTFTAVERLGLPADARRYGIARAILDHFGVLSIRLVTSNPLKTLALAEAGVTVVSTIPTPLFATPHSRRHLLAKIARGHVFAGGEGNAEQE